MRTRNPNRTAEAKEQLLQQIMTCLAEAVGHSMHHAYSEIQFLPGGHTLQYKGGKLTFNNIEIGSDMTLVKVINEVDDKYFETISAAIDTFVASANPKDPEYYRKWREKNPNYTKNYRRANREWYQNYQREWRKKRNSEALNA